MNGEAPQRTARAVILARGVGRRMRAPHGSASLSPEQRAAAEAGEKALMPIAGRPFVEYTLRSLAAAGVDDVALVVAPDHSALRGAFPGDRAPGGVRLSWVVQEEPRGTADAVLAAASWAGEKPFLVLNGDNLYPPAALRAVAALAGPGLAAFERDELVASSNIPPDRVASFALVERDESGALLRIVEKPAAVEMDRAGPRALVSMNLWRFDRRIFRACREVTPSPRGELELTSAVMRARADGVTFAVVPAAGPVLDVSRRGDVADVERRVEAMGYGAGGPE